MKVRRCVLHQISRLLRNSESNKCYHARTFSLWDRDKTSDWKQAVSEAEKIVGYPTSFMSLRCLLSDELANVAIQVRKLVGTKHPLLKTARGFLENGKHSLQTRGLIVLLMAKAAGPREEAFDEHEMVSGIYQSQRQLAEITEMIHLANLVHRGVINLDTLTEGDGSYTNMEFGNKIAVLSGDFLLTSASKGLAELNNTKVVELMSQAIGDMMSAEFTCLRDRNGHATLPTAGVTFADWERQTFLQTGSLLAKSCLSALELAGHETELQEAAAKFGENIAYARQMNEDIHPFMNTGTELTGILSSAPILHHLEVCGGSSIDPAIRPEQIVSLIESNPAVLDWCIEKCREYGHAALSMIEPFQESDAKTALTNIVHATTNFNTRKAKS